MTVAVPLAPSLAPPPPPAVFVERARLHARVDAGTEESITLVCGPLGSGKTSLLAAWARSRDEAVAWLSLTPADDDAARFWPAVLAALCAAGPDCAAAALPAISEPAEAPEFARRLVNALAEDSEPRVLVLDDVHLLRSPACLRTLGFVLTHLPASLRVVLSTRADPRLPLQDARLAGRLSEIRGAELAFTEAEATQLLAAHGIALEPRLVALLHARTEGWAAALRLAALHLCDGDDPERLVREFGGDDRELAEYLLSELLDGRPPRERAFLLRTALVDRISGELADALTGRSAGHDTLSELRRTNGFVIPLDRREHWYRYHTLFSGVLRARAQHELASELPALRGRAARWYERAGKPDEALPHAIAAADWELAAKLVAVQWFDVLARDGAASVRALLLQFPPERVAADPGLRCVLGCVLLELGDVDAGRAELARAGEAGAEPLAALLGARLDGDPAAAAAAAERLRGDAADAGNVVESAIDLSLGATRLWTGRADECAVALRRALDRATAAGLDCLAVTALGHLALAELWRSGPDAADAPARAALELAARRGWSDPPQTAAALVAACASALCGLRLEAARAFATRARGAGAASGDPHLALVFAAAVAALDTVEADAAAGLGAALAAGARHSAAVFPSPGADAPLEVRALLAGGDAGGALERLRALPPAAFSATRVELRVLEALALDGLGRTADADAALESALAAAEESGHLLVFRGGGDRLLELLRRRIRAGTQHRAVAGELLGALGNGSVRRHVHTPLLEPLSDRELTVLRYLPTFLPTREIASELYVSPNTVKSHLRNIYRKLDVQCRREAIDRARDLRLLSSGAWR